MWTLLRHNDVEHDACWSLILIEDDKPIFELTIERYNVLESSPALWTYERAMKVCDLLNAQTDELLDFYEPEDEEDEHGEG